VLVVSILRMERILYLSGYAYPRLTRLGLHSELILGIFSTHMISRPSSTSLLTRLALMNPAAPVTTVFIQLFFPMLSNFLSIRLSITAIVETVKPCAPRTNSTNDARKYPP
jgi:hypothetical protein